MGADLTATLFALSGCFEPMARRRLIMIPDTPSNNGNGAKPDSSSQALVPLITPEIRIEEARRLARLPAGEWRVHYKDVAIRLYMAPRDLEGMIKDIIKEDRAAI